MFDETESAQKEKEKKENLRKANSQDQECIIASKEFKKKEAYAQKAAVIQGGVSFDLEKVGFLLRQSFAPEESDQEKKFVNLNRVNGHGVLHGKNDVLHAPRKIGGVSVRIPSQKIADRTEPHSNNERDHERVEPFPNVFLRFIESIEESEKKTKETAPERKPLIPDREEVSNRAKVESGEVGVGVKHKINDSREDELNQEKEAAVLNEQGKIHAGAFESLNGKIRCNQYRDNREYPNGLNGDETGIKQERKHLTN